MEYGNFGLAAAGLKEGRRVSRWSWMTDNRSIFLLPAASVPIVNIHTEPLRTIAERNGGMVECLAAIREVTSTGAVRTGWVPTVDDLLADDWYIC